MFKLTIIGNKFFDVCYFLKVSVYDFHKYQQYKNNLEFFYVGDNNRAPYLEQ